MFLALPFAKRFAGTNGLRKKTKRTRFEGKGKPIGSLKERRKIHFDAPIRQHQGGGLGKPWGCAGLPVHRLPLSQRACQEVAEGGACGFGGLLRQLGAPKPRLPRHEAHQYLRAWAFRGYFFLFLLIHIYVYIYIYRFSGVGSGNP